MSLVDRTLDKLVAAEGSTHASVYKLHNEYDGFNKYSYQEAVFTRFKLFCGEDLVIHVQVVREKVLKIQETVAISTKELTAASPSTRTQCTRGDNFRSV